MDFEVLKPDDELSSRPSSEGAESAPAESAAEKSAPEDGQIEAGIPRKRRRRRKLISPAHEARIAAYRGLVEDRGWIFSPPTPPQPVSALFVHLTDNQVASLSA